MSLWKELSEREQGRACRRHASCLENSVTDFGTSYWQPAQIITDAASCANGKPSLPISIATVVPIANGMSKVAGINLGEKGRDKDHRASYK